MKNVTVTLDEETARWARVEAARRDMSMSALLREILERERDLHGSYEGAKRRYQSRAAAALKSPTDRYPTRDETHDRAGLR